MKEERKMMKVRYRGLAFAAALLAYMALFSGCATIPKEADQAESLKSAATTYWKLRTEGKVEEIFKMEDKESVEKRNKSGIPLMEYYKSEAKVAETSTLNSIKNIRVSGDRGRVDLDFTFVVPEVSRPFHQILTDEWVFKNGEWLHLFTH